MGILVSQKAADFGTIVPVWVKPITAKKNHFQLKKMVFIYAKGILCNLVTGGINKFIFQELE
jgi:hypothetical protein